MMKDGACALAAVGRRVVAVSTTAAVARRVRREIIERASSKKGAE